LFWFQEHLADGIEVVRVDSAEQKADIFTKGLGPQEFEPKRLLIMGW
jgi:hypothetical protein